MISFFIFVISVVAIATSIFAVGYAREYPRSMRMLLGMLYHWFILSMILVVSARDAFHFLVFWELMALTSYFLVVLHHEKPEARRAGLIYAVMTHAGTAFIAIAFWLLFRRAGSFAFEDFQRYSVSLPMGVKNAVFLCALLGFGTKAGMIPFHIWLPEAHPQAPSPVSALMSGVMIKTAIYALLRFIFNFLGPVPSWWGSLVLFLAIVSTLLGVMYALMEHDLKRLLAFHSIENVGIILLGVGMSLLFLSNSQFIFASFAFIAALYHVLNHAIFKGLLFLGSGAVLSQTRTANMEELGGLIKKMPWTAVFFLVGAMAISALPPLNGFVSEWMTFIALLSGFQCRGTGIRFFAPILASLLGLAGALAATCFVKAFGITFLGASRSEHAEHAREVNLSMRIGLGILAFGCLFFALTAPCIVTLLGRVAADLGGQEIASSSFVGSQFLVHPSGLTQSSPLWIFFLLTGMLAVVLIAVRMLRGKLNYSVGETWGCGFSPWTPRMQYSATGYSKPLRRIFSFLYQPTRQVEIEDEGHEVLRTAMRFKTKIRPLFEEIFYRPPVKLLLFFSKQAKRIQTGHIQLYLSYIFVTLIVLLFLTRRF
jgi:hydrogenase-4 component B